MEWLIVQFRWRKSLYLVVTEGILIWTELFCWSRVKTELATSDMLAWIDTSDQKEAVIKQQDEDSKHELKWEEACDSDKSGKRDDKIQSIVKERIR